jgi:hypothetical protein
MIGLPDVVGLLRVVSVEQIVRGTVRFAALVGQGNESGVELLDEAIDPVIVGNGPSVLPRHLTHLSVDERHGGRRFTKGEPLDDRCEFGL